MQTHCSEVPRPLREVDRDPPRNPIHREQPSTCEDGEFPTLLEIYRVLVTAALEQWAAEHQHQLSQDTAQEVDAIASRLATSLLSGRSIDNLGDDFGSRVELLFPEERAQRALTLIDVVADWAARRPSNQHHAAAGSVAATPTAEPSLAQPAAAAEPPPGNDQLPAPAFLRSDKVDEEDHKSLYGPRAPVKAIVGTLVAFAFLVGAIVAGLYWFNQRDEVAETDTQTAATEAGEGNAGTEVDATAEPAPEPATAEPGEESGATNESAEANGSGEAEDPAEAAVEPEPEPTPDEPPPIVPAFWADVTPILNPGSAEIIARPTASARRTALS